MNYLKEVIPAIAVSTTSIDLVSTYKQINGQKIILEVLAGNVWVKPGTTAATTSNANKMVGVTSKEFIVSNGLKVISDVTGATIQLWVMG